MKKSLLHILCIVFLCLLGVSCHDTPVSRAYWKLQPEHIINKSKTKVSEIIGRYTIVPLETTDSSLIGKITKIIRYRDRFYLSFNRTSLVVFDCHGKFMYKVEDVGRAPNEYLDLGDFDICKDRIMILDYRKVLFYDLEGNFLSSHKLDFVATNLKCIDGHKFLFHTSGEDNMIYLTDTTFKILDKQIKLNESTNDIRFPTFIHFQDYIVYPCGYSTDYLAYDPKSDQFSNITLAEHETSFDNQTEEELIKKYGHNFASDMASSYTLNCRQTCIRGKCLLDYLYEGKEYWSLYDLKSRKSLDILSDNLIDDIMFTDNDFLIYSTIHESDYKFLAPVWPSRIAEGIEEYLRVNPEEKNDRYVLEMQEKLTALSNVDNANPFIIEFNFE